MFPLLLLKGSLIGLSISMPMGPTGMLCLRYSMVRGKKFGVASGMGIALAEAFCGALTVIGLASLTTFIETYQTSLQLIATIFLFYCGLLMLKADRQNKTKKNETEVIQSGRFSVFIKMFLLTLTNPLTLLSFVAIFSTMGVETLENDLMAVALLSFGVFIGSTAWWVLVSSSSSYFAKKVQSSSARLINRVAGFLVIGASIFSFFSILNSHL